MPRSTIAPFNLGKIENKGYEVEMTYSKSIHRDLFVIVKGNINYNDNKVLYIDELQRDNTYAYPYRQTGYSIGQQWGLNALGFFKDQAEIDNYARYDGIQPRPEDLKLLNIFLVIAKITRQYLLQYFPLIEYLQFYGQLSN